MLCSSVQNCRIVITHEGVGVLVTIMRMNMLQFCFEVQCNCWKLLTMIIETILNDGCNQVSVESTTL